MKLASFDIFDTVLIRKCGAAENIFYLLAKLLFPDNRALQEAFLLWRRTTPEKLVPEEGRVEVTLENLYSYAASAGFSCYSVDEFIGKELETEAENLVCNTTIRELIEQKRASGFKIAFISDMYLGSSFLRDILVREACWQAGDEIFVSSECNARKDTGKLFEYVKNKLTPDHWEHYGDNKRSDVKIPRKYGIKASWINTQYTDVEKECLQISNICADPYQLKICAAASRAARLHLGNTPDVVLAADFVAPTYLPYISFLRERARAEGIKRLYFLSRDGWILHQAAECGGFDGIELKDFFVSRRSLMLPYLACDFSRDAYLRIIDNNTLLRKNVSSLLARLNLTRAFLAEQFNCYFPYEKIINAGQEKDFLDKIFSGKASDFLQQEAQKQYELLCAYFKQEGLFDGVPGAMIDVGWLGTSRLMINTILRYNNMPDIKFFYFGVRKDVLPLKDGVYESLFRADQWDTSQPFLLEQYFSASFYPSTHGYIKEGNLIHPVWEAGKNPTATDIVNSNKTVMCMVSKLAGTSISWRNILLWASFSFENLLSWKHKIDVSPFLLCEQIEDSPPVRRLTLYDIFNIVVCGGRRTDFDIASMQLTIGYELTICLWRIHKISERIRLLIRRCILRLYRGFN